MAFDSSQIRFRASTSTLSQRPPPIGRKGTYIRRFRCRRSRWHESGAGERAKRRLRPTRLARDARFLASVNEHDTSQPGDNIQMQPKDRYADTPSAYTRYGPERYRRPQLVSALWKTRESMRTDFRLRRNINNQASECSQSIAIPIQSAGFQLGEGTCAPEWSQES